MLAHAPMCHEERDAAKATITTPIMTPPHAQLIVASLATPVFRWETDFPAKMKLTFRIGNFPAHESGVTNAA